MDLGTLTSTRKTQQAITPALLRVFKDKLKAERLAKYDKRLLRVVATFAFLGSLMFNENLFVKHNEFTPDNTNDHGLGGQSYQFCPSVPQATFLD